MKTLTGQRFLSGVFLGAWLIAATGISERGAWAQDAPAGGDQTRELDGVHLYNIMGAFQYSSIPVQFLSAADPSAYGPEYSGLVSASVAYTHRFGRRRNRFAATYNPSYNRYFTYSGLNSFNQNLTLEYSALIGTRWTFSMAATAEDATLDQYLFQPLASSTLAGPTTVDGLVGSAGSTSALTASAAGAALYGVKRRAVSGDVSLGYRPTTRWSIVSRAYATESSSPGGQQQDLAPLAPHVFAAEAYVTANYSVTPGTVIGGRVAVMQSRSSFGDYQVTAETLSIQKKFGRRWFASVDGGAGEISTLGNSVIAPHGSSYLYSAILGAAGREHSFTAIYSRQVGDYYGFAAGSTTSASATWSWRDRSKKWGITATGARQQLAGSSLGNLTVWEGSVGVSRALGRQANVSWSYVNLTETASTVRPGTYTVHAVRVSVMWVPFLREVARLNRAIVVD